MELKFCIDCGHWHREVKKNSGQLVWDCIRDTNECKCRKLVPRRFKQSFA